MLNELEILKIIENGENSFVEFKDDSVENKKIAKEVIALSNHKGGYIFLGVSDNKEIIGMSRDDNEERIINICIDIVKPGVNPSYYELKIRNFKIGIIEIETGVNKPYYLEEKAVIDGRNKNVKTYYNRYGSTTREVQDRDELQRLFQASQNIHFEIITASYYKLEDLDENKIIEYLKNFRDLSEINDDYKLDLFCNLEILTKIGEIYKPSIAGLLLFGKNRVSKYLPQAGLLCVKVDGIEISDEKLNHKFFEKNLFSNFEDAIDFFKLYNTHSFTIENSKRINQFDYPEKTFREVLANAIIHRDYTISGNQISIWIYNDRIEVKSPGKLPNTITIDKMRVGIKYHRNPVLAQYFYDANIVEKMGQGIPKANRWLKENGNPELEISENENEVVVIMKK